MQLPFFQTFLVWKISSIQWDYAHAHNTHSHTHTYTHNLRYTLTYTHIHKCTHTHTRRHTGSHTFIHTYTRRHEHIHSHTYTYTHLRKTNCHKHLHAHFTHKNSIGDRRISVNAHVIMSIISSHSRTVLYSSTYIRAISIISKPSFSRKYSMDFQLQVVCSDVVTYNDH